MTEKESKINEKIALYYELKKSNKEMEKCIESIEAEIKEFMGEEEKCICGDFEVDWKTSKRRTLDVTSLRVEEPDTYNKYAVENVSRRFTVKKIKEEK